MMTAAYQHPAILILLAIAMLVVPSTASAICNCSGEDLDCGDFSSQCEAQSCYSYCRSIGFGDVFGLERDEADGTVCQDRAGPYCAPPIANSSAVTVRGNTSVEITLGASDPDSSKITYRIVDPPLHGILGMVTGDRVVYTPEENYTGPDSFGYRAYDGALESDTATITVTVGPGCIMVAPHWFSGMVTIGGVPAPGGLGIGVEGTGVRIATGGDPPLTREDGSFGSPDGTVPGLAVGGCIDEGTPLTFTIDGVPAEVRERNTSGPWIPAYPFRAGGSTCLDLRVASTTPPPDSVFINAITVIITNATHGFYQKTTVEKEPWIECRVTQGLFDIRISATGFHVFRDVPIRGRDATIAIYEQGIPVSVERHVWFGSRVVEYQYFATETRTFDIIVSVNGDPGVYDVKHLTISVFPGPDGVKAGSSQGVASPVAFDPPLAQ